MKNIVLLVITALITVSGIAQETAFTAKDLKVSKYIEGTLLLPNDVEKPKLVIIIAGSGPTDKNGNSGLTKNNSLKYLAEGLSKEGIATFRYNKRSVKMIMDRDPAMTSIEFDDFIEDAIGVVEYFKRSDEFSQIHVAGHSQGSLIGMIAANKRADSFISLAGAGQSIDALIVAQIAKQQPGLDKSAATAFLEMREKGSTKNYQPALESIFGPQIQPFMKNWMEYNPAGIIKELDIPVLIINGDKDLQTTVTEAELLKSSKPEAAYHIIKNMNHIFKEIEGNDMENQKSYYELKTPIMPELVDIIAAFVKK